MSKNIPYNHEVLKWAREHLGYTEEDIADKFKNKTIEDIKNWENGSDSPTYIQLERLAYEIYKKPLAIFFFPDPPEIDDVTKSFRTIADYEINQLPPKLKLLIDKAKSLQLNIKELTKEECISNDFILNNLEFSNQMSTEHMAKKLRNYLGISLEEQSKCKNITTALNMWVSKIEEKGIFVFKEPFKDDNYSGFCLYDLDSPIIYLNNSKSKTRQIFTLFHELSHLLFNTSGINSKKYMDYNQGMEESIEIHCNKLAAKFLIPDKHFESNIMNIEISEKSIEDLAQFYKVSKEAILRKLLDLKKVTPAYYEKKRTEWNKIAEEFSNKNRKGIYIYNINSYLSKSYKTLVFDKYLKKELTQEQTSNYFNIKISVLNDLFNIYSKQGSK